MRARRLVLGAAWRRSARGRALCSTHAARLATGAGVLVLGAMFAEHAATALGSEPPALDAGPAPPRTTTPVLEPALAAAAATPNAAAPATATLAPFEYRLRATLDPVAHTVSGSGTVRWTNTSVAPTSELWLHLYLNAFRDERSLFLRRPGSGSALRGGGIELERLTSAELGGEDLLARAAPHSPDDPEDATDIRVALPQPVAPGESLTLELAWTSRLPPVTARTGYAGDFHMVAQWFPKLARLEPTGEWAHFPFHSNAEFYADFARYDVTLDVPEAMVVGATGALAESHVENGRRVERYVAEPVHDFAWVAAERLLERRERIDGVDVRVLFAPDHEQNAERILESLAFGLPHFSERYGRYPYDTLTVVEPPAEAEGAGGMEYPTLITTGGPWYAGAVDRRIERVTLHELGHQWFFGVLASHEARWPFLDEGLDSFATGEAMRAAWGLGSLVDWPDLELGTDALERARAADAAHRTPAGAPAAEFASWADLGALVYARTATALRTLGGVYGEAALERALGRYAERLRFGHPTPSDLEQALAEELPAEAVAFFHTAIFEKGWVNFSVGRLESRVALPEGAPGALDLASRAPDHAGRVVVRREGTLVLPVVVELIAEDGTRTRHTWNGEDDSVTLDYSGESPLVSAIVDPDLSIPLDQNLLDNAKSLEPVGPWRVLERASTWAELLLLGLGP